MSVQLLERAVQATTPVVESVSPDQFALPSPCASWNVGEVIDHMIGVQSSFASRFGAPEPAATDDVRERFREATGASIAAFSGDGVMEQVVEMPMGQVPGSFIVRLAAADLFVHGWDVAKATGQSTDLDPALAEDLLGGVRGMLGEQMRGLDGQKPFGPEQVAPDGAPAADRLAAFMGRVV